MSKLAEEIAEAVFNEYKWPQDRASEPKGQKIIAAMTVVIDEKLSGVRLSVEQAYLETLCTIHEEAWNSVKINNVIKTVEDNIRKLLNHSHNGSNIVVPLKKPSEDLNRFHGHSNLNEKDF